MINMGKMVVRMSAKDTIVKKPQQATCDRIELNRQVLKWQKGLKEVEKAIEGTNHKKK